MSNTWKRSQKRNVELGSTAHNDVFIKVNNFGGETDEVYILNDGNISCVGTTLNDVDFDYASMRLPAGAALCSYTLDVNGLLTENPTKIGKSLSDPFFGKVLFDIQSNVANSKFFKNGVNLDLCDTSSNTKPLWKKHGGCGIVTTSRMSPSTNPPVITSADITILMLGNDTEIEFYMIPIILAEKQVIYHIFPYEENAFVKINDIWFSKIQMYHQGYNINQFLTIEIESSHQFFAPIRRDDASGILYFMEDEKFKIVNFFGDEIVKLNLYLSRIEMQISQQTNAKSYKEIQW